MAIAIFRVMGNIGIRYENQAMFLEWGEGEIKLGRG